MLFTMLVLNSCIASSTTSSDVTVNAPPSLINAVSKLVDASAESVNASTNPTLDASATSNPLKAQELEILKNYSSKHITPAKRKAAAERYRALHGSVMAKEAVKGALKVTPQQFLPGSIPHYFGPYANWANSPMPKGGVTSITLVAGGSGYTSPKVRIDDAYNNTSTSLVHATATATADPTTGAITSLVLTSNGNGYNEPVVIIGGAGTGADATATIGNIGANRLTGGIHKFVDSLPNLTAAGANDLGNYIPVAVPDKVTYNVSAQNRSDYYEIAVVQYTQRLHKDLPPTTLRGYVQIETDVNKGTSQHIALKYPNGSIIKNVTGTQVYAYDKPSYLGPMIVAHRGKPVRVKFHNYLPNGVDGDLFIPVDTTVMGAGMGPNMSMAQSV